MLGVALIYSVTSTLGKQAVAASSPLFFAAVYVPLLTLLLTPLGLRNLKGGMWGIFTSGAIRAAFLPALFYGLMVLPHMSAIAMTRVAYMISLKRLSLLMGVLYGYFLFHEQGIAGRLTGTLLMLCGVALITLCP